MTLIGKIVQLKSGGPSMTVTASTTLYGFHYRCQWFVGDQLLERLFVPEAPQRGR